MSLCLSPHSWKSLSCIGSLLIFCAVPTAAEESALPPLPSFDMDYPSAYHIVLPPLEEELHLHGGSHLYEPSDISNSIYAHDAEHNALRLDEYWQEPQPLSLPYAYQGAHAVDWFPWEKWFGCPGTQWEPRFVAYGSYEVFGTFYEQNRQRRDGIGHQLVVDLDLMLTGTERIHVQFRPLGRDNTGGSFWQLNEPQQYFDNSSGVPQRWWIEGELQSLFGDVIQNERLQLDVNYTIGKFPLLLHNGLLMNDEITGVAIGKNTILSTPFSNINVQAFYAFDDVDSFPRNGDLFGGHVTGDYRHAFLEATVAQLHREGDFKSTYLAGSATQFFGPLTLAGRAMFKLGDAASGGDGQLFVLETSYTRSVPHTIQEATGIELAVAYINAFQANDGWTSISGGNFSRLRNSFTVNPLLNLVVAAQPVETKGASVGVQLFRHHEDESLTPEFAYEEQSADTSWGVGLRYQRKLTPRMFLELRGIKTWSEARPLVREGVFASTFWIF